MIKAKDFEVLSLQVTIFTPALIFLPSKILQFLMEKYATIFDAAPVSVPLPSGIPKDIPRILFSNLNKTLKLEISEARVNIFRYFQPNEDVDRDEFYKICKSIFNDYVICTSAKIGRLALIAVKICKQENPSLALAKHFCKEQYIIEPFNRPQNFEINSHKKYVFRDFDINSWVRCKAEILQEGNSPVIFVQQDINTLAEEVETREFTISMLQRFMSIISIEQNSILEKYFPSHA